jgi:hypothetical protein
VDESGIVVPSVGVPGAVASGAVVAASSAARELVASCFEQAAVASIAAATLINRRLRFMSFTSIALA